MLVKNNLKSSARIHANPDGFNTPFALPDPLQLLIFPSGTALAPLVVVEVDEM